MSPDLAQRARLLLTRVANPELGDPDWKTSRADARAALSLAHGVPAAFIDSLGYDITDAAYADVRASWVCQIAMFGWHGHFDWPQLDTAHGYWLEARPDLAAGDDWFADGWAAHLARYPDGQCDPHGPQCEICQPFTLLEGS